MLTIILKLIQITKENNNAYKKCTIEKETEHIKTKNCIFKKLIQIFVYLYKLLNTIKAQMTRDGYR